MGQINLGGANAAVQLQGYTDSSITSDQTFTFPDTGGELVITPGTADIETTGSIIVGDTGRFAKVVVDNERIQGVGYGLNKVYELAYIRVISATGCQNTPGFTFSNFRSGTPMFVTAARNAATAPSNYLFVGDNAGRAFTGFIGCGNNIQFGLSDIDSDAPEYRTWICIHKDMVSAVSPLPTNTTRASLP